VPAKIIDGREIANQIKIRLKDEVEALKAVEYHPHLVAVEIGSHSASKLYLQNQKRSCEQLGIQFSLKTLPEDISETEALDKINWLNEDPKITGIIIQMPVPNHINLRILHLGVLPEKDVEGMNPINLGQVIYGKPNLAPCTAMSAVQLIKATGIDFYGKEAVVVGHSEIVGKPISLLLLDQFCTVTVCHIGTKNLQTHTRAADILVVAVGKANLIGGDMIKPGAVVIDVGINVIAKKDTDGNLLYDEYKIPKTVTVGDVNFQEAAQVASYITPVPGGVGPLTVATLLSNVVIAAKIAARQL